MAHSNRLSHLSNRLQVNPESFLDIIPQQYTGIASKLHHHHQQQQQQ